MSISPEQVLKSRITELYNCGRCPSQHGVTCVNLINKERDSPKIMSLIGDEHCSTEHACHGELEHVQGGKGRPGFLKVK